MTTTFATVPTGDSLPGQFTEGTLGIYRNGRWTSGTLITTEAGALSGVAGIKNSGDLVCDALTATTIPYLNSSKILTSSVVTPTELGYLAGATSALQTQITAKAPAASPTLTGTITANGTVILGLADNTTVIDLRCPKQTTVGAAGAASDLPAHPTGWVEVNIQGTAYVIPFYAKA